MDVLFIEPERVTAQTILKSTRKMISMELVEYKSPSIPGASFFFNRKNEYGRIYNSTVYQ